MLTARKKKRAGISRWREKEESKKKKKKKKDSKKKIISSYNIYDRLHKILRERQMLMLYQQFTD